MMAFQQAQADGVCLRYPNDLGGLHPNLTHEAAINMLMRAYNLAVTTPFTWGYIDKPSDGQFFLIFMAHQLPFPNDGIRYQDQEQRYVFPANTAGNNRELEILEIKFGFIPGHDQVAYRVRRRYRFTKGGHPQLILIHYSRGQPVPIIPSMAAQPVRSYPLRPYNEPAVFVIGDRQGQKVYTGGIPGAERGQTLPPNVMGMGFGNPQAMLAQQNSNMEAYERRTQRERDRSASMSARASQPRPEDDDSADESDLISTRTLALTRYRRNHEFMNEVFMHAAFRNVLEKNAESKPAYSIFTSHDIESKIVGAKTKEDIADLESKAAARKAAREADERAEIAMEGLTSTSTEETT